MKPEIYFIARDGVVHVFDAYGIAFGTVIWNAETQARFTPEEATLRAAELNFEAGWSAPCVVNGVELDVAGVVPPAVEGVVVDHDYPTNQHTDCCELLGISADPSSDGPTLLEAVASLQQERDDAEASARALHAEFGTLTGLLKEWQRFAHVEGGSISELRKMTDAVLTAVKGGVA